MKYEKYDIGASASALSYEFFSEGKKGKIKKIVQYEPMDSTERIFNCGFGDFDPVSGLIDDDAISNNGDGPRVIATVIETIYFFTSVYTDKTIHFRGSDIRRTKIYGKIISDYYYDLIKDFEIFGVTDIGKDKERDVERFQKAKKGDYDAFLIKRRIFGTNLY